MVAYRRAASAYFSFVSGEGGGMECTPTCYLALAFLSDRLLAYLDASLYQILVVKQQVLFQTGIGDTAGVSDLLCRDISVRT